MSDNKNRPPTAASPKSIRKNFHGCNLLLSVFLNFFTVWSEDTDCSPGIKYRDFPNISFKEWTDHDFPSGMGGFPTSNHTRIFYIDDEDMGHVLRPFAIPISKYIKGVPQSKRHFIVYQSMQLSEYCLALGGILTFVFSTIHCVKTDDTGPGHGSPPPAMYGMGIGVLVGCAFLIPHYVKYAHLRKSIRIYNETLGRCKQGP